ncbi:MAG: adenylyltransferase/cytidyltransferase family protein [Methanobrevibacter sp.]|nr:adenylyltransferase/cytidyltransferase family protein [Methanobrevibacter sp.]
MTTGFYAGKFFPMHKGHLYCIDTAAKQCDEVTVILFINGDDELKYFRENGHDDPMLEVEPRIKKAQEICNLYPNVKFGVIDCLPLKLPEGTEDWDAETPEVRKFVPHMDYVYSSEPSYDDYFQRAYPEATHILVDVERKNYPISSTLIRAMEILEEKEKWMV